MMRIWLSFSRQKIITLALVLLLALVVVQTPGRRASAAGPFTVDTTADTRDLANNGLCADAGGKCSLRAAIEQATNSGGATVINLPAGTYTLSGAAGFAELKTGSAPGTNITVNGAAQDTTILQAAPGSRVFNIDYAFHGGVTVTLNSLTIKDGQAGAGGGGAIVDGDPGDVLNIQQVVFDGNQAASANGGAIAFTGGGSLTIQDSLFKNNVSPAGNGGAIHFAQTQAGSFQINDTQFSGNSAGSGALGGQGGAINVGCTLCSPFSISGAVFSGNTAAPAGASGGQGGALMVGAGNLTVQYSRIVGNQAAGGGSGIYHGGSGAVDATHNWWGCSGGPGAIGCDTAANVAGTLTTSPFIDALFNTFLPALLN